MTSIGTTGKPHATLARVAALSLILALVAFWSWAFLIYEAPGNPDRLEDRSWAMAAEQRCVRMVATVDKLPAAADSSSPVDQPVDDLRVLPGGSDEDRALVDKRREDWEVYLVDRQVHARRLRTEGDVRPYLTALPSGAGSHVERMNGFARVNDMESCLDPGDL